MPERLVFTDPDAASDLLTFASRSARMGDGGVRLQARAGTLAMTTAALAPQGLLDRTPTVLGMRAIPIDPEIECDLVVAASALSRGDDDRQVLLPETALAPAWAGISPPRAGWTAAERGIPASVLASRAQYGIASVATRVPTDAGEDAVRLVRADVWGMPDDDLLGLPLGAAFAAFGLGFIGGDETAALRRHEGWSRLTLRRGHVLVRMPRRSGLTPVRATGPR